MLRVLKRVFVVLAGVSILACGSTTFQSTWTAPDAGQLQIQDGTKVLVLFPGSNEAKRRGLEAALVNELREHGIDAVAAHSVIPADVASDAQEAKPRVAKTGAEYALVMQITGSEQQITGTPSMWGSGFYGPGYGWGGWGWGWGGGMDVRTDTLVSVQTLVYDVKKEKLVWAGQSQTMNPSKAESFARDLIRAVGNEMQKEGLVGPARS